MGDAELHAYVILYDILHVGALRKQPDEKPYRDEWKRILPLFEYMSFDTATVFYGAIIEQLKLNNAVPLASFVMFFMHPPCGVVNPYTNHRFLVSFNEVLAQEARRRHEFQAIIRSLLTVESPVLTFLLERTSGTARTILAGHTQLTKFLPLASCKPSRRVEDLYRMSVDRHYHTLATVFDWLVKGFSGSFNAEKVDTLTFSSLETDKDKEKRNTRIAQLHQVFHTDGTTEEALIERIKSDIPNCRKP